MSLIKCANYENHEAINAVIKEANARLYEIDKASGIENPKPTYQEGSIPCFFCHDGLGMPDAFEDLFSATLMGKP